MYLYRIYNSFRNCAKGTFIFTKSLIFTLHTIPSSLVALKASACGGEYIVYNILYLDDYPYLKCMFVVFHYRRKSLTFSNVSPCHVRLGLGTKIFTEEITDVINVYLTLLGFSVDKRSMQFQ